MSFRTALLAGLAAYAAASPMPQQLDLDAILAQGPPATATIASTPGVISMAVTSLASAAAADVTAAPLPQTTVAADSDLSKRVVAPSGQSDINSPACQARPAQPVGPGPVPPTDTDSGFLSYPAYNASSGVAPVPSGYSLAFNSLFAENNAYGYMGYSLLNSYDTVGCAAQCNKIVGCQAINVAFERAPQVDPGTGCTNPPSTTLIKCVFWGGPVTPQNAVNNGQWRGNDFHVVIAGSNGYTKNDPTIGQVVPGYTLVGNLGNATVNAPTYDVNGVYSYMGYKAYNDGAAFSIERCAAACSAQSAYNIAYPPADGSTPTTCQYFATYYLMKNGNVQSQVCSMYSESWGTQYAVNTGYFYGSDVYTIRSSVIYSNTTYPNNGVAS